MATNPRGLVATVREALVDYGTWRMQKPRREKALTALDALLAECERLRQRVIDEHGDAEEMRRERDLLRTTIDAYDSPGALGEVFAAIATHFVEPAERRAEAAERERDEAIEAGQLMYDKFRDEQVRARRYEEALREIAKRRTQQWPEPIVAFAEVCEIARAALAERSDSTAAWEPPPVC